MVSVLRGKHDPRDYHGSCESLASPNGRRCLLLRSLTACNSPLNGSLLVYSLGEKAETAPAVRLGSVGHLLSVVIHVVELLDWAFLRRVFDPRCRFRSFGDVKPGLFFTPYV